MKEAFSEVAHTVKDLEALTKRIRYDLTAAQGKISQLLEAIAELSLPVKPKPYACPDCGLTFKRDDLRDEHLVNVHGKKTVEQ